MRTIFFVILILSSLCLSAKAQSYYGTDDLKTFREGRDSEFRNLDESPLNEEDFDAFKGLDYFPVDLSFRFTARFRRTADELHFMMPTSSGKSKRFVKYGVFEFKLGRKRFSLNAYQIDSRIIEEFPEYADLLFIPFKDLTNGAETYGGGRYIDIKVPSGDRAVLDFNLAYNPNCAYGSDRFSCPIPPKENYLKVRVNAGEKTYPTGGEVASRK